MPNFHDRLHLRNQEGVYRLIGSDNQDYGEIEFKTAQDFDETDPINSDLWKKVQVSIRGQTKEGYINIKSNSLIERVTYSTSSIDNAKAINTFFQSIVLAKLKPESKLAEVLSRLRISLEDYDQNTLQAAEKLLGTDPSPRKMKELFLEKLRVLGPEKKPILLEVFEKLAVSMIENRTLYLDNIPDQLKTHAICLAAVKQEPWGIQHVPGYLITEELCFATINKNGLALRYVPKRFQREELYVTAVQQDGRSFSLVPAAFQTLDLSFMAVRQNGLALKDIPKRFQSPELYLIAVNQNALALDYVPLDYKDEAMCQLAVKNKGLALKYVPEHMKTVPICLSAIESDECAYSYVPESMKSFDFYCAALERNGLLLQGILEPSYGAREERFDFQKTAKLCYIATKQNPEILDYVPDVHKTEEFYLALLSEKRPQSAEGFNFDKLASDLAHKISRYRNKEIQESLAKIALSSNQSFYKNLSEIAQNAAGILPAVFLSSLVDPSMDISRLVKKLKSLSKLLKDQKKPLLQSLLNLEISLYYLIGLDHQQKIAVIENCLDSDDSEEILLRTQLMSVLTDTEFDLSEVKDYSSKELIKLLMKSLIQGEFIDTSIENYEEKFKRTFLSSRIPSAIFTYSLAFEGDEEMKEIIKQFISDVLEGSFIDNRNEHNSHGKTLTSEQKTAWQTGLSEDLTDLLHAGSEELDFKKFLFEKLVTDRHGTLDLLKLVLKLKKEELSAKLISDDTDAKSVEELLTSLYFSSEKATQVLLLKKLTELLKDDEYDGLEFKNDVSVKLRQILAPPVAEKAVLITDSDDWQDLFLCGTEVSGSCQRVDGSTDFNKCLMGYVMDGKIRIIKIADSEGKIISRAIIKLSLDEDDNPALVLERIYPEDGGMYEKLITLAALHKAELLGVSLYEYNPSSRIKLHSDGNFAPYEYEDAGGGVTEGNYIISVREVTS